MGKNTNCVVLEHHFVTSKALLDRLLKLYEQNIKEKIEKGIIKKTDKGIITSISLFILQIYKVREKQKLKRKIPRKSKLKAFE